MASHQADRSPTDLVDFLCKPVCLSLQLPLGETFTDCSGWHMPHWVAVGNDLHKRRAFSRVKNPSQVMTLCVICRGSTLSDWYKGAVRFADAERLIWVIYSRLRLSDEWEKWVDEKKLRKYNKISSHYHKHHHCWAICTLNSVQSLFHNTNPYPYLDTLKHFKITQGPGKEYWTRKKLKLVQFFMLWMHSVKYWVLSVSILGIDMCQLFACVKIILSPQEVFVLKFARAYFSTDNVCFQSVRCAEHASCAKTGLRMSHLRQLFETKIEKQGDCHSIITVNAI